MTAPIRALLGSGGLVALVAVSFTGASYCGGFAKTKDVEAAVSGERRVQAEIDKRQDEDLSELKPALRRANRGIDRLLEAGGMFPEPDGGE